MACGEAVTVHRSQGTVRGACGASGPLTYADVDIVVWDCPVCAGANADTVDA